MQTKWQRVRYMPATPLYDDGRPVTASKEHIALSLEAARDGMVLLKNEGAILPFKKGAKLALFGKAQADYVKGGGGSGDVTVRYVTSPLDALRERESSGDIALCAELSDYYRDYVAQKLEKGEEPGRIAEPDLPGDLLDQARAKADTAVIFLCRYSGEGWDRTGQPDDGDFYPSPAERKMIDQVRARFDRIVVVLNTGGMMDVSWFRDDPGFGGAVLAWQGGLEGGRAIAELLLGDYCPSGRLTDTFARDFASYPSSDTFNRSEDYVEYNEDIFVGYRYFETIPGAREKVCYPFGFGLSYTDFALNDVHFACEQDRLVLSGVVTNTGSVCGRQVVQAYVTPPRGRLTKPMKALVGFHKTAALGPGQSETVTIAFTPRDCAGYDDEGAIKKSCWLMEKGEYVFSLGFDVEHTKSAGETMTLDEDRILEKHRARCVPRQLSSRLLEDGTHVRAKNARRLPRPIDHSEAIPFELPTEEAGAALAPVLPIKNETLDDVAAGKLSLDRFISLLSDREMVGLLGGQPNRGVANTLGMGNLPGRGIPNVMTADGPQGLRIQKECGVCTTAFPCATMLACTWDTALAERIGRAAAEEVSENGMGMWLAPALNIHRNPLCGRNFEYYSEDPLVSGRMAAAVVRGTQSVGVSACIKHFACNNKEVNRMESDSRLSERALREIYLRGFELCVREAAPWALMSSYNMINGVRSSENRELLTDILRGEWGFDGMVTTDWWNHALQYREIAAGNDVKMGVGMPRMTYAALMNGQLKREDLKASVRRLLTMILRLR